MSLIEVSDLSRTFTVRRKAGRFRRTSHEVRAVDGLSFAVEPRRDGRLHRPERRREVDDDQDAHRHPGARRRAAVGGRARPVAGPGGAHPPHRRGLRPAHHAVVGPAAARLLRAAAPHLPDRARALPGATSRSSPSCSTWPTCSTPRCASSRSASGCAATSRRRCCTTRRSSTSTSRRSGSTWSARGGCASSSTVNRERGSPCCSPPTTCRTSSSSARGSWSSTTARSVYDGSLPGLHAHGASTRTLVVDLVRRHRPIDVPGATVSKVDGPRQWLSFPADAAAAPVVAPSPRRTTSPTSPCRNRPSRTSSATLYTS